MDAMTLEEMQAAFEQLRAWSEQAWQAIIDAFQPLIDFLNRAWRDLCRMHIIPRQHRDTMMRRKVRRYYAFVQLRT